MPSFLRLLCLTSVALLLCVWSDSPKPSAVQAGEKEKAAKQPDAATIAKLIEQLGSKDFTERQLATKALEAIGYPALDALRKAAMGNNVEVAQRAGSLVAVIENGLDSLLADYRGYGLPLPPEDAKLVKFQSGSRYIFNDKVMPPTYFLGLLLKPASKDKPALLLVGVEEVSVDSDKTIEVVEPKPELVKELDIRWWGPSPFEMNGGLALALQCKARGWNALAEQLLTASIKEDVGHRSSLFYQPVNLPKRTAVAYLAWAYSGNELVKPDTDRTKTAKRIKALFAAEPRLKNEPKNTQALLKSLEAALVPSTAKPGSVERMIDDLTDMCNMGRRPTEPDPRYTRLAQMGFAAVPALIKHLDDDRLTRNIQKGFHNVSHPYNIRVQDIVSGLLKDMAGELDYVSEETAAQAWWEKAKKQGEEAYLLAHVLPSRENALWPNDVKLIIITEKYPRHLPKLYKTVLDERPKMQSLTLAEAVARSSLPDDTKRELFLHAASNEDLDHRRYGLAQLQKLDPQQFMKILLATLEAFPKTPTKPYWDCPEALYADLVSATEDPKAWEMLERVAKRADVGLRMEFVKWVDYSYVGDRQRQLRLKFLAAFLEDPADFRAPQRTFVDPYAGITVRDLALMKIASVLKMPDKPDTLWTPEQWKELREKVKKALKG